MKKQINYPKIGQFRNTVKAVIERAFYVGQDINDEPIFNYNLPKPILNFEGTIKIHGTNGGVCYNNVMGFWAQSRKRILSLENDNAGFAFFAHANQEWFENRITQIAELCNISLLENTISIYGEWAGNGIQKGVAINQLERSFYIFGVKVSPFEEGVDAYWLSCNGIRNRSNRIFNINDFEKFNLKIDFNNPEEAINLLTSITEYVEKECPVAMSFGFIGTGEGVVWTAEYKGVYYRFKVKGEKHQSSRVKKLASVDPHKIENVKKFIEYAVTDSRFSQALENIFGINVSPDIKKLGDVIKWTINDILKEEVDVMIESGLVPKDIGGKVANEVKQRFLKLI